MAVVGAAPCQCFSFGGKPDHVAGADFLDRSTFPLGAAAAGDDDESLA